MSKSNAFETAFLQLVFQGVGIANLADNAASGPLTNLYVAAHTGDPGEGGNQSVNEISYTGYARVAVARSNAGWTVSGNSVSPVANIPWGTMTAGAGGNITHWSVGANVSGGGTIYYSGTVTPNIVVANGVSPYLTTATAVTEE